MLVLDHVVPHLHRRINQVEGPKSHLTRTAMMVLAVTLHNIPEGMAVGVVYAGLVSVSSGITAGGALALAIGIAIQNFPEGAMIYVVVEELIPEMSVGEHSNVGVLAFAVGFSLMMALDVALG